MALVNHIAEPVKHIADWASLGLLVGTLLSWLPEATIVLSFVWLCLRVYEGWLSILLKRKELKE